MKLFSRNGINYYPFNLHFLSTDFVMLGKRILAFLLLISSYGWCGFPDHIEREWKNLEDVLCKERNVILYIIDREKDPVFSASIQSAILEMLGDTNASLIKTKEQEDTDLVLAVIISHNEDSATITLFLAGEDDQEDAKPLFFDCFQVHKDKAFEEIVTQMKQRLIEIQGCKGFRLQPYIGYTGMGELE